MARVSYGSRAGGASDYLSGNGGFAYRQSSANGVYASLRELTDALKREVEACVQSELPDLTTCELSIRDDATIPLLRPAIGPYADSGEHDLPAEYKNEWTDGTEGFPGVSGILPKATITSILAAPLGQPRQIVQRAASRAVVQALEATDGFKYNFNNAWAARDEGGLRFSYICQDSMQNKDRHANGFTKTQKHLKGEGERGPRKPTYDCKGSISVKFSANRRRVDVYYRHYAIHSSVAERKPPSRPVTKHRVSRSSLPVDSYPEVAPSEPDTGGLLGALQDQTSAYTDSQGMVLPSDRTESSSIGQPLKRKRMSDVPARRDPNKPLSLVELLQQSDGAKSPTATEKAQPKATSTATVPPPIDYTLPSWQAPLPPPPAPAATPRYNPQPTTGPTSTAYGRWAGPPYPPPYQRQQYQQSTPAQPTQNAQVAIPRATPSYSNTTPRQEYLGAPKGKPHPKAQGLFSALKPVRKEDFTSYEPHFVIYNSHRAKTSCQNCRLSKKKVVHISPTVVRVAQLTDDSAQCDEGKPMCGACARTGKLECVYEGAPTRTPIYGSSYQAAPQQQSTPASAPANAPDKQSYQGAAAVTSTYPMAASSTQGYGTASAASSQTFGALTQSQPMALEAKEGSPDPWFPRRQGGMAMPEGEERSLMQARKLESEG